MVFTSNIFIFYFLPLLLLLYYALPFRYRNGLLTLAAYVFYGWDRPWFVLLMMYSTVCHYYAARIIAAPSSSPRRRKITLTVAIVNSLLLLGYFKYGVFAQENANGLLHLFGQQGFRILQITLPIGISFYTFQTISYTVDVYRGAAPPAQRLTDFTCFVALYPHLIAGPIVRYNTIADQFGHRQHSYDRFASGVALFILGFAKKILLANAMGRIADAVFAAGAPDALTAWWGLLAYAGQIYFDFSAYSDIAVGLGRMVGFEIPRNFNSPYRSRSLTEFWQRWHMSLSSFLRDYLYFPLGGNRYGARRSMLNLWLVMLIGGLWHGSSWQFVLWGAYHGMWLAAERGFAKRDGLWAFLPKPLQMAVTFFFVLLSWVPFRADSWASMVAYLRAMFGLGAALPHSQLIRGEVFSPHHVIMVGICAFVVTRKTQAWDLARTVTWPKLAWMLPLFALGLAAMYTQSSNPFLYFQF